MQPKNITFGYLAEKKNAKIKEIPMPELAEDELLVKQEACNICTTDYQQWLGLREHQGYPMAGGHECSGIVIAKAKLSAIPTRSAIESVYFMIIVVTVMSVNLVKLRIVKTNGNLERIIQKSFMGFLDLRIILFVKPRASSR